ncbi:MAG: Type 1 glutamine amidotransferase-like domain-containing protein [Actinomycetes bacterium]
MNGTLALVGGAEWTDGCTFDAGLVEGAEEVLVVPSALAYEQPLHAIDRANRWFGALGVGVRVLEVYRRSEALTVPVDSVRSASCIYVAGGSPMHLRSVLLGTPLLDALIAAWRGGATVAVAAEAASTLCSHMVDNRGGAFTVGLELVTTMTVVPRANQWSHDKWHRTVALAPRGLPVVGVDEATALIHRPDGSWQVEGVGGVRVVVDGQTADIDALPRMLNPALDG